MKPLQDIKSFDVALSFAGDDRTVVEKVADYLIKNNSIVFYDALFQIDLLGVDLVTTLRTIYAEKANYCAIFISQNYTRRRWPNLVERIAILDRATRNSESYLIPIVLDGGSWLEGLPSTIGFLDAKEMSAIEIADVILKKITKRRVPAQDDELFWRLALDHQVLGVFLVNFADCEERTRVKWSGDTSRMEALHSMGALLSKYEMCELDSNVFEAEMDFVVRVKLLQRGVRFRNFLFDEFLRRVPEAK